MKSKLKIYLEIAISLCFFSTALLAQNDQKHTRKPIILKQPADSLVVKDVNGYSERTLYGHVWLTQGNINLFSDFAQQNEEANTVFLKKNVNIKQGTVNLSTSEAVYYGFTQMAYTKSSVSIIDRNTTLTALSGSYDAYENIAEFNNNITAENDSALLFANHLIYHRDKRKSFVDGDAYIFGKFTNAIIRADSIRFFAEENYALAKGIPILFQIDTTNKQYAPSTWIMDTMTISANKMEAFLNTANEQYLCYGDVQINRDSLAAKAENAFYNKYNNEIYLKGNPIIWYSENQIHSDSICIKFDGNEIKQIRAYGNAIVMMTNDRVNKKRIDQISSDTLIIDFQNRQISKLFTNGLSKSLYFYSDKEGLIGADKTSTQKIIIDFNDGKVKKINWLGSSEKEFIEGSRLINKEPDFYLNNFKWLDEKPIKKFLFFSC